MMRYTMMGIFTPNIRDSNSINERSLSTSEPELTILAKTAPSVPAIRIGIRSAYARRSIDQISRLGKFEHSVKLTLGNVESIVHRCIRYSLLHGGGIFSQLKGDELEICIFVRKRGKQTFFGFPCIHEDGKIPEKCYETRLNSLLSSTVAPGSLNCIS